jgi:hypothetical protein
LDTISYDIYTKEPVMKKSVYTLCTVLYLMGAALVPAEARPVVHKGEVTFDGWRNNVTIEEDIMGEESYRFYFYAGTGQDLRVRLSTMSDMVYMNIYAPGQKRGDRAFFAGFKDGYVLKGELERSGVYTVEVYMIQDASAQDLTESFTLYMSLN